MFYHAASALKGLVDDKSPQFDPSTQLRQSLARLIRTLHFFVFFINIWSEVIQGTSFPGIIWMPRVVQEK